LNLKNQKEALTPFALKIVTGILTNQLPKEFNLKILNEKLLKLGGIFSSSKLSLALNELAHHQLLMASGAGPTRLFIQFEAQKTWERLLALPLAPFFREVNTNYIPKDQSLFCVAGENALAHFSNLAEPTTPTVAMNIKDFRQIYQEAKSKIPTEDFGKPCVVQIWKERPQLFAIDGFLNPIDIFFSMRQHHDERVQMALDEMMKSYQLNRKDF
jgi:hypothetical protein